MNRRRFLKAAITVPAIALVPAVVNSSAVDSITANNKGGIFIYSGRFLSSHHVSIHNLIRSHSLCNNIHYNGYHIEHIRPSGLVSNAFFTLTCDKEIEFASELEALCSNFDLVRVRGSGKIIREERKNK